MAVMTPTVGGTNQVAVLRVLATILGSVIATLFYLFLPTSGNILLFATWAFSIPCFWMILNHKHGRFGMFSLLSYNLIVPYMYNHRNEEQTIDVIELAYMRCATVSAGVIIGKRNNLLFSEKALTSFLFNPHRAHCDSIYMAI